VLIETVVVIARANQPGIQPVHTPAVTVQDPGDLPLVEQDLQSIGCHDQLVTIS
jgi:hypothetical protein